MYYLQSRYYNPEWGRFVNADATIGKISALLTHNMYTYCLNNPINMQDKSGYWAVRVNKESLEFGGLGGVGSGDIEAPSSEIEVASSSAAVEEDFVAESGIEGAGEVVDSMPDTLNPKDVNFMQSSIKNQTGEHTVLDNAEALKNGTLDPNDLPKIKVWQDDSGKIWSLDHRRLGAFRLSGLDEVPVQWATPQEVESQMWKMTTQTDGASIKLKLGNGNSMIIK